MENVIPSLLSGACSIFPVTAVSTAPTARYRKTVVRKLQNSKTFFFNILYEVTQLSIPTQAQLQRHRLKFIKNHIKKLLHVSVYDHLQGVTMPSLKSLLF